MILPFLWKHIKPYKWYYVVMLLGPIANALQPLLYNYSIKLLLDVMSNASVVTSKMLVWPIFLFIVSDIIINVFWRISNVAEWRSEPYVRRSILMSAYDYVQHHSYLFFQNTFAGSISSKIKGILDGYDKFWGEMHHGIISKALKIVICLTMLSVMYFRIGLFITGWSIVFGLVMYRFSVRLNQLAFSETESRHSLMGKIGDKITNILTVFSFSGRKRELNILDKDIKEDFIPKQIRLYKYDFKMHLSMWVLYSSKILFVLFYTIHLRMIGKLSLGDFVFILNIVLLIAEDIYAITISMQDFARKMGDFKSSLSVLNIPQENKDRPYAMPMRMKGNGIAFHNLEFGYGEKLVFQKLNLVIKPGEKVGLVGVSGAGKSTLVNLMLRYFNPIKGDIFIGGQDIAGVMQDSLREQMAVIPQDTMLFHRNIMENIRYGKFNATDKEVIEAAKKAHIHEYIEGLEKGYKTEVGERGVKLSGGQRQRIAIARAILKDAPILILDEATSALDSETEQLIQNSLEHLIRNQHKTVIAIAHRLSTLKNMDRIIVLDQGRIIEEGTHRELMKNARSVYKRLWEHQEI